MSQKNFQQPGARAVKKAAFISGLPPRKRRKAAHSGRLFLYNAVFRALQFILERGSLREIRLERVDRHALLRHRIAVADRHTAVLRTVEIVRDTERRADLILTAVALADGTGLVKIDHKALRKAVVNLERRAGELLRKRQHRGLVRRDGRVQAQDDAHVVLLRVEHLLVVRLGEQREHRAVKAIGGFDDERDELLVRLGVEVLHLLTAVFLMLRKVEIRAVVRAVDLAPAEREQELDVARGLRVMREFLVVVEAQMFGGKTQILKILPAVRLEVVVQLGVRALLAEGLELHLLELDRAEREVARRDLVAERLADLPDAERQLRAHGALYVEEVDILALRVFGAQVNDALAVVRYAAERLEHQVEFADVREVVLAAVRAGDVMILDVLEHLLLRHAVGMRLRVEIVDQVVGAVAHLALLAVEQRVGERGHMAARLPNARVHQNVGVHLVAVSALLDEALSPRFLDVVFQPCAERAVIPRIGEAAVNFAARKNKAPALAERDNFFHRLFFRLQNLVHFE